MKTKPNALAGLAEDIERESTAQAADSTGRTAAPGRVKMGRPRIEDSHKTPARDTRKAMTVYFPPEVSRGLKGMAVQEDTTLQALIGEAIDMLMRDRGQHPFGAR